MKLQNSLFRILLGIVVSIISFISLNNALSHIKAIEHLLALLTIKTGISTDSIAKYSREIMYAIQLCGIYAGVLGIFKARMTKFFAFIYFSFVLAEFYISYTSSNLSRNVFLEGLLSLSVFGGILSIN